MGQRGERKWAGAGKGRAAQVEKKKKKREKKKKNSIFGAQKTKLINRK